MSSQTLPSPNPRKHQAFIKTHDREIVLSPNTILVYDVFKPGDGSAVGYVGIKDSIETYRFFDKVFFRESNLRVTSDFQLSSNPDSICGYVDIDDVHTDYTKVINRSKNVISLKEKKRRNFLNSLSKDEKEYINMLYKIRVIKMERKQETTALETALLDKVEYMKTHIGKKFNLKNYMKGISKKYKFKYEKLDSGYKKRIACRRWAKRDFLENTNKNN